MNFIFGTTGFAKEVDWLMQDLYSSNGVDYRPDFIVAEDGNALIGGSINAIKIISESEFLVIYATVETANCFIAVGKPNIKQLIVNKIKSKAPACKFPNIIHPHASYDKRPGKLMLGEGNIICSKSVLTTDISLGNFVHVNLDCTIGHDSILGDFSTLSPGVHASGNVRIAEKVFVGTGAVILERITICADAVIGAGAVVVKHLTEPGIYVGIPAKKV